MLVTFGFKFGFTPGRTITLLRRAPVAQHAPEYHVGQRHEPAQKHVARRRPVADDEGPQDEHLYVRASRIRLPRPQCPEAFERVAALEPILLLTDLRPEPLDAPHPRLRAIRAADAVDVSAAPKQGPNDVQSRKSRRADTQYFEGNGQRRFVSGPMGGPRVHGCTIRQ